MVIIKVQNGLSLPFTVLCARIVVVNLIGAVAIAAEEGF